jgi:hypothetical protein
MEDTLVGWSPSETEIAKKAFEIAYKRELSTLISAVKDRVNNIQEVEDIWRLHDLLSTKRYELDGKYDYHCPQLVLIFAGLVKDGWLSIDELDGLDQDKIVKINLLSKM